MIRRLSYIAFALLALVAAPSCAEDDDVRTRHDILLSPQAEASTKAPIDGTAMPAGRTMVVSAYYNAERGESGNYFTGVGFSKATSTWTAAGTPRYWPFDGTLDFLMYSHDGLSVTPVWEDKVTAGVTLAVADNGTIQTDILHGRLGRQARASGGNPVVMRHAQALVMFTASSEVGYDASSNYGITIERIALEGARYSGTVHVAFDAMQDGGWCSWSDLASRQDKDVPNAGGAMAFPYDVPAEAVDIRTAGCHLGIGGAGILLPEQPAVGICVYYKLHNGYDDAGNAIDNTLQKALTLSESWKEGKKYVYELHFIMDEIVVRPTVTDWANREVEEAVIPQPDPANGHEYVEIAGMKWATMNVGASSVTDYGLYFQWGDTQGYTAAQAGSGTGQKYFGWADYKYGNGTSSPGAAGMAKYNSTDGLTVLEPSDDAVAAAWGGNWRMPTTAEFAALGAAVNTAWTTDYKGTGVAGLVCTDKTDATKELFFPAAGNCDYGFRYNVGSFGYFWSSSVYSSNVQNAYNLLFLSGGVYWQLNSNRRYGYSVRGVLGN